MVMTDFAEFSLWLLCSAHEDFPDLPFLMENTYTLFDGAEWLGRQLCAGHMFRTCKALGPTLISALPTKKIKKEIRE